MILLLAWRNLWRNKRRSLITIASIAFAVVFATTNASLNRGAWDRMIDNVAGYYMGYMQIHLEGYWDDRTLDNTMAVDPRIDSILRAHPKVTSVTPRLESFALVAAGETTRGAAIVGIDPARENALTGLESRIVQGTYVEDTGCLVAEGLARSLEVDAGDTLVLLSQGYRGATAAGLFPILGIVKFASPQLNSRMIYLPLAEAQNFFSTEERLTSLVLGIDNGFNPGPLAQRIAGEIGPEYEVMSWRELMPELVQAMDADAAGDVIIRGILYVIIAFGVFGTLLMMTEERQHEFGVLVSVGLRRTILASLLFLETAFLAMTGSVVGWIISWPVVYWLNVDPIRFTGDLAKAYEKFGIEPIFPTALDADIFIEQAVIVLILSLIMAIQPTLRTLNLRPVEAMRK